MGAKLSCTLPSPFYPTTGGASAGNCTGDHMFGGDTCTPVCKSHFRLTKNTKCLEDGTVEEAICVANTCNCQNGVASAGASCTGHAHAHCASCNKGYHLSTSGGAPSCSSCPSGQYQDTAASTAAACTAPPILASLPRTPATVSSTSFPTAPVPTEARKCVTTPSCQDLSYYYSEDCATACKVSGSSASQACTATKQKFKAKSCH